MPGTFLCAPTKKQRLQGETMLKLRSMLPVLVSVLAAVAVSGPLAAQGYPDRPITLIVPFAAGGPSDTVGRLVADHLGRSLGQQIVVENLGGAGGTLGAERAAKAAPDGYTLLTHHSGLPAGAALYANLRYDSKTAFEPLGLVNTGPMVLLSRKTLETANAKDLFDWLKAQGSKATVGFAGVGSNSYICSTLLQQLLGVKLAMVPYRGTGPAMNDLVGGQIDVLCDQATTAVPQIQGGTVKAYAVTSAERLDSIKDVPSAREAGLPEFSVTIWNGLYAPKGVPKEVVDKINAAIGKMVTDPAVLERFAATGTQPFPADMRSPAAHAQFLTGEFARFEAMFKAVGVTPQEAK
jgi:tripartite-type tricarboxylate transporter receptor subunit TctC